jgi:hypothetical protein
MIPDPRLRFGIVGGFNFVVDYGVFLLLFRVFGLPLLLPTASPCWWRQATATLEQALDLSGPGDRATRLAALSGVPGVQSVRPSC